MEIREFTTSYWKIWLPHKQGILPAEGDPFPKIVSYESTCCCHASMSDQLTRYWIQKNLDVDYREIIEIPRSKIAIKRALYELFKWVFFILTFISFLFFWNAIFDNRGRGVAISLTLLIVFAFMTRFSGFLYYRLAIKAQVEATLEINRINDRINSKGLMVTVGPFCEWIEINNTIN